MTDDVVLDLCPHCGSFVNEDAKVCPGCKKALAQDEERNIGNLEDELSIQCNVCGNFVEAGSEICPRCESPVKATAKLHETDLDPDEYEGFLDFLLDNDKVVEIEDSETHVSLDDLDEMISSDKSIQMDEFFDDIGLEGVPDDEAEEKPDVHDELRKTVIIESVVDRVTEEVHFDEINEEDIVRLCANCGGLVSSKAEECSVCGEELTQENLLIPKNVKRDILETMSYGEAESTMKKAFGISDDWEAEVKEEEHELAEHIICTHCGAFIPHDAAECTTCGTGIDDMSILDEIEPPFDEFSVNVCARCGAFLNEDAGACNVCGFEVDTDEPDIPTAKEIEPGRDDDKAESILKNLFGVAEIEEIEVVDESGGEIALCPDCGALVAPDAEVCSICNSSLIENEADIIDLEKEIEDLSESNCPNCGSELPAGISDCTICGFSFFDDDPAVSELEDIESSESVDLATDILDTLDLELPDLEVSDDEPIEGLPDEDSDESDLDELLVYAEPEEKIEDEEPQDISDEEFENLLGEIDEIVLKESAEEWAAKPVERVEISLEEKLILLKKAFDTGAISKELYRKNLEIFLDDLVVVEEHMARLPRDDGDGELEDVITKPAEEEIVEETTFEDVEEEPVYDEEIEPSVESETEDVPEDLDDEEDLPELEVTEDETIYDEDIENLVSEEEYIEPEEEAEEEFEDDDEVIKNKIKESELKEQYNLSTWDYGVHASLATSLIYLALNWVIPGDYSISLAIIFGAILLAGIFLLINYRGAFTGKDFGRGIIFIVGGFMISFILVHWYLDIFTEEIGTFAQPVFDRVLLSIGILLIGVGIIWIRSKIRYIFMWILGTTLLFLFALGELAYFEQWMFSPVKPPGGVIFGIGLSMIFFSTIMLAYEKMIENSIEADIVRGDISYLRKDYETALTSYDSALFKTRDEIIKDDSTPVPVNYDVPWYSKGAALILMGELEEGIKCMDMALAINPKNEMAWTNKGNAMSRLGHFEEAMKCYEMAIEVNPRYVIALNNMGNALARRKEYVNALKYYNTAIKMSPGYQDAWINKGYVLAKMGKNDMALKCIEMVTKNSAAPLVSSVSGS